MPLAIGSAAPPGNVDFVLDTLNIRHFFEVVFHARNVTNGKPNPEIYQKVVSGLGLVPEDCLIFEDSPTGAEAARRAGCSLVIVTTTHPESEFLQFPNVMKFIKDYSETSLNQLISRKVLK